MLYARSTAAPISLMLNFAGTKLISIGTPASRRFLMPLSASSKRPCTRILLKEAVLAPSSETWTAFTPKSLKRLQFSGVR